ncbi:MAG: glutamine-hydrolyzing GMP synthase [Deltaproteobacteria bacterium]|nr:glutamine-hydrolyzing GMP synthase [Deltaproteobacteria bacterium]
MSPSNESLAIIDLGGQYCHMIARRLRDLGVRSDIREPETSAGDLASYAGIILSGGPRSVYEDDAPSVDEEILDLDVPVLGICYGHQLLAQIAGATVERRKGEYGPTTLTVLAEDALFRATPRQQTVWMSHSDVVTALPRGWEALAATSECTTAAIANLEARVFGVQFHPEVVHSEYGRAILRNFTESVCGVPVPESRESRVAALTRHVREVVGDRSVFFLVSGGVDSTVAFVLCSRAVGHDRVLGLYVDTGLMRKGETDELRQNLAAMGVADRVQVRDESARFLKALDGVIDPEEKRRIIGRLFVEVQSEALGELGIHEAKWVLGQGTIYPDTIESGGAQGRAALIKTHHNRCEEILQMLREGRVVEPIAELYKDEVREVGQELGLDARLTNRWPFPGPGLAIRCLGSGTEGPARPLAEPQLEGLEAVTLPLRSVGVQGDARTYREAAALRSPLDYERLRRISTSVCNEITTVNRVVAVVAGPDRPLEGLRVYRRGMTAERLETLREADFIVRRVLRETGLTDAVWQFPVVILPVGWDGGETIVLRPVCSEDGMTASVGELPEDVVRRMGEEILVLPSVELVVLDATSKPPGTIEWE